MSTYGIATGFDGTPTALHSLSVPLFWRYEVGIPDDWRQGREIAGDLTTRAVGPVTITWYGNFSEDEIEYLLENIYTSDTVELTIRSPHRGTAGAPWELFNVLARWIDYSDGTGRYLQNGFWYNAALEFIVVEELGEEP